MERIPRYSDTITPSRTLSDPARPNIRVIPPKSAKLDGYEPPTIEIYAILRKIRKLGALRPENMRFMAYFSTFPTYRHQKRYARTIRLIKKCHVFVKKCHVIPLARPYEHLAYFRQKDRTL